jgi:DNA-binding transcriptional ArsR family regulator
MKDLLAIAQALSDESRVRSLMALRRGELCVCQLTALLKLATPTVSRHLSILYAAGLVESRKEGRWVYYRLAEPAADSPERGALDWALAALADEPAIALDETSLCCIVACEKEELCRSQRN